ASVCETMAEGVLAIGRSSTGPNSDTLPLPGGSSEGLSPPQPKLPAHTFRLTSIATPKPPPFNPPPVSGDRGVPFVPSEGRPFGCSTIRLLFEVGVPWI